KISSNATNQSVTRYWRVNLVKSTGKNTENTTIDDYKNATNQSVTRYWRVNLVKSTGKNTENTTIDDYKVYRNGLYKVTINNINTVGYETPEDAEKQEEIVPVDGAVNVEVTIEVSPWDVYESNTDM
ncbi:Major fimbrial subunit protein type IV, Fimbrillin, C-terminal, partial [Popillia japonica]